jgi:hypothetical protein
MEHEGKRKKIGRKGKKGKIIHRKNDSNDGGQNGVLNKR